MERSSPQHQKIRPAMPLGPNPSLRLDFEASVPRGLVADLYTLGILKNTRRLAWHPERNLGIWNCGKDSEQEKSACPHEATPKFIGPLHLS